MNSNCIRSINRGMILLFMGCALLACGGQKINRKPLHNPEPAPLMTVADDHLKVTLLDVLISNDPASWVKNARWDEYIIALEPRDHQQLHIQAITVVDSYGQAHGPQYRRRSLNRAFKRIKKDHQNQGLDVALGHHPNRDLATLAAGGSIGAVAATSTSSAYLSGSAAVGAGAVVVAVPALAVTAVVRTVNHHQVQQVLNQKAVQLPASLSFDDQPWSMIYPAVPAPQAMVIEYLVNGRSHILHIDLSQALPQLHVKSPSP